MQAGKTASYIPCFKIICNVHVNIWSFWSFSRAGGKPALVKCWESWWDWDSLTWAGAEWEWANPEICTLKCLGERDEVLFPLSHHVRAKSRTWKWNCKWRTSSRGPELAGHFQHTSICPAGTRTELKQVKKHSKFPDNWNNLLTTQAWALQRNGDCAKATIWD